MPKTGPWWSTHYGSREEIVNALIARDGFICGICERPLTIRKGEYHIDHRLPHTQGGSHELANLQLAHPKCNPIKGGASGWPGRAGQRRNPRLPGFEGTEEEENALWSR